MTLELSSQVKTHIVLTFDKIKHKITADEEKFLRTAGDSDKIYTDDGLLKVHQITSIVPLEVYYRDNPKEKPFYDNYQNVRDMPSINNVISGLPKERKKKAIWSLINGFKKHFHGRPIPAKSQAVLDGFLQKIA